MEAEVMDVIWEKGQPVTVGDVADSLARRDPPLAYSTIKTILTNLSDKGYLSKRSAGRANEFMAKKSKMHFQRDVIGGVVSSLLRDYRNPLLTHLAQELADDPESIAEFERLLAERKKQRSRDA
ncbi:MAG: BlaI/MecI/CopY family transcriptional regulator [Candidatus Eremiobacteraeota bacterium]|nr:BlaI/MecI/CopY family transcriptional regulator [Candidatus Eremiobacteraeota bacterium]